MFPLLRSLRKFGWASPYGAVIAASILFLVAWTFPPQIYSSYIQEPDRMFLDPFTCLFFFVCVAAFVGGMKITNFLSPGSWTAARRVEKTDSPFLFIGVPLVLGSLYCAAALIQIGANLNVLALLASQQGQSIKDYAAAGGTGAAGLLAHGPEMLIGILWWSAYRLQQMQLAASAKTILALLWGIGFVLSALTSIASVSRTELISLLIGLLVIYMFSRQEKGKLTVKSGFILGSIAAGFILALFLALSFLRGGITSQLLIGSLIGYAISSYNRLASVLHGDLNYIFAGHGVYLFMYLQGEPTLNGIFHYREALHWPAFLDLFHSEFSSNELSGLNGQYVWAGVFGYLFADIGWVSLLYLLLVGVLAGYMWIGFRKGATLPVMLYPWIATWIFFWNGSNVLFNGTFVNIVVVGVGLAAWDNLLLRRAAAAAPGHRSAPH